MITAHWFSYAGDAEILPLSIEAFKIVCPEARLIVVDDAHNPCTAETAKRCKDLGAIWNQSSWERDGNLNGPQCIEGITSEMLFNTRMSSDICIKIDCDTIVANRSWLDRFIVSDCNFTGADDRGGVYGCCYGLKALTINRLNVMVRENPLPLGYPEDLGIAIKHAASYGRKNFLHIPMKLPIPDQYGNGPHGEFIAYNWLFDDPSLYIPKYSIINCGNRVAERSLQHRQIEVMRELLGLIKAHSRNLLTSSCARIIGT